MWEYIKVYAICIWADIAIAVVRMKIAVVEMMIGVYEKILELIRA